MSADPSSAAVFNLLSDGQFHSGQDLADQLQLSRSAVWRGIEKLRGWGASIDAVTGRGYRLRDSAEPLSADDIKKYLSAATAQKISTVETLFAINSTNDYVLKSGRCDAGHYRVCLAEVQTAGRGRRNRAWCSAIGGSINLSIAWSYKLLPKDFSCLSLVAALSLAKTLQHILPSSAMVGCKWPNDILADGKKLAGMLIDVKGEVQGPIDVVLGMGINLRLPETLKASIAAEGRHQVTDIVSIDDSQLANRNKIISVLLDSLIMDLEVFSRSGFSTFFPQWRQYDVLFDQQVEIEVDGGMQAGKAMGITEQGALRVLGDKQQHHVVAGEVNLSAVL